MREIKFRAWEKNLKEIIPVENIDFQDRMINKNSAWRTFEEIELMQYTGLKDKNVKEIYEGDILNIFLGEKLTETSKVSYSEKDASFFIGYVYVGGYVRNNFTFEVIGNIYENPNLLKED